ncbi:MAG: 16S rRNA (uracil(1498)-N(3))-methyltransferase [Coriobacteriia bacterium]|nr:16S rRNA (uracil(1498)-N(3))-methyltransferase [Coriobacteriia bacterium]
MAIPRFFAVSDNADRYLIGEEVTVGLSVQALHHANRVLRLRVGELVEIVLRDVWTTYLSEITYISAKGMVVKVLEKLPVRSLPISFDLFWGYAKHGKNDLIVRQAVEIGCERLIPVKFERSVLRSSDQSDEKRTQRLLAISESAAMQAHRSVIPPVEYTITFDDLVERSESYDTVIVAWEQSDVAALSFTIENELKKEPQHIALVIGPEGGIDPSEIEILASRGAQVAGMGATILRVETACTVACGILADLIRARTYGNVPDEEGGSITRLGSEA